MQLFCGFFETSMPTVLIEIMLKGYLIRQDIIQFTISFSSIGQDKSKLQKQKKLLILIEMIA